jgi:predicted amidohydrolase YtcJ
MRNIALLGLGALCFCSSVPAHQETPDLILYNGKIFTSDVAHPYVQALAICGDRIVATGDSGKLKATAGPRTKTIDLAGRTVIPGINDAHNHIDIQPTNVVDVPLKSMDPTWGQVKDAIAATASHSPANSSLAVTIGSTVFRDLSVNRDSLDVVAPHNPVMMVTFTGHGFILNSAALQTYGVKEDQADPVGGRFERNSQGRLTGVVREYAGFDIERAAANSVPDTVAVNQLRHTLDEAARFGITSIQDMSSSIPPTRAVSLLEKVPTQIRIRVICMPGTTPVGRDVQECQGTPRHPNEFITVSGMKWMPDGVPIEGTFTPRDAIQMPAAPPFDQMFHDLPLTFPKTELSAMLGESARNDDQLMVHVAGYRGAGAMLDAMDAAGGTRRWEGHRVRFEHGDGLFPDLIQRVKAYGIVVVQNPSHLVVFDSGGPTGNGVFREAQPLKSLLTAGIPVALGSDGPTNPYLNIMFATIHSNRPAEAITREQAVIAYTLTSAYAEFEEKSKGSLEPGKLADLAVLSQDIFTVPIPELPKTESILTLVGGKTVYDAKVLRTK